MQNGLDHAKIRAVYIGVFAVAAILLLFAFYWQVVEGARFSKLAASRFTDSVIPSLRGTIYSADGSTLAYSEPRYNVYVYMPELFFAEEKGLQTRDDFVNGIGPVLGLEPEVLKKSLQDNFDSGILWIRVAASISLEQRELIQSLHQSRGQDGAEAGQLVGYFFEYTSFRIYPEARLASQVLGLTTLRDGGKTSGLGGLEGAWDGNLEPLEGYIGGERDALGNAVGLASERTIEAQRGNSVFTSIDKYVQKAVQDKLKWAVKEYGAKSGSVVVMDPKTGEILAMANYPDYDPNKRDAKDPSAYGNKAMSEPYEVGSVGKTFTLAAAVDLGKVTPETVVIQGHKGCEKIHEQLEPVCTHDKLPQPPMPIKEAFALSDNIYFLHLAQLMDDDQFYNYLNKFGVGKPTGVDADGESFGYLKDWKEWNIGDVTAYSYGHSYQMNALQMLSGLSAIANKGVRMQPHFVKRIVQADGREINFEPVALERVLKESTVKQMDEMMHVIYQNNIFWWEHQYDDLRNYKIAMKSGTALIPFKDKPGYSDSYNATYVGYDASSERKFAMLTRLEDPQYGNLASYNSRVLWLEIFSVIKDHLGVPRIGAK